MQRSQINSLRSPRRGSGMQAPIGNVNPGSNYKNQEG